MDSPRTDGSWWAVRVRTLVVTEDGNDRDPGHRGTSEENETGACQFKGQPYSVAKGRSPDDLYAPEGRIRVR